ncbi:unnamed protein product [Lepeophtheirus salmonis]|uniref:(salmon louse) hypothetical protein n=1 Tax=Lepeophtheirus salmonis TaxID=72036 RepID=A0A7R8CY87_LEPSM|nr:unnamed protein product [Lepeophtheirus salmonis]CAF2966990.1 unnamed protein product [Lepeophtheirus salmonis]
MVIRLFYYRTTGQLTAKKNGIGGPAEKGKQNWKYRPMMIPCLANTVLIFWSPKGRVGPIHTPFQKLYSEKFNVCINFISCYTEIGTNKTFNTRIIRKHLAYSVH